MTVSSASSTWNNSGLLSVGYFGQGSLTITTGGTVNSAGGYIAQNSGSVGNVLVSGAGSQWNNSGVVTLGAGGTITLASGGTGSSTALEIGGSMTVTGAGSKWTAVTGDVVVGQSTSPGALTVANGGILNNAGNSFHRTSRRYCDRNQPGSQWNSASLSVGYSGNGTLHIQNGGIVTTSGSTLLSTFGGAGNITVDGAGSQLIASGHIDVGNSGPGTLLIQNGGVANSNGGLVGTNAGGIGGVTVTGPGSQWNDSGTLTIGQSGIGTLTISSGGEVSDVNAIVGDNPGSTGNVLVDAATFINTGALSIGVGGGIGTVTVMDSADLSASSITVGSGGSLIIDPSIVNTGSFTLSPGGVLSLDISGLTPDYSQLDVSGTGLFQGIIDFDFIDDFAPTRSESFDLINVSGSANFIGATVQIEGLAPGFLYTDTFSGGQFTLIADNNGVSASATPEPSFAWLMCGILIALSIISLRRKDVEDQRCQN